MRRFTTMLVAIAFLVTAGFAYGQQQETSPSHEHLKLHGTLIGNWQYEGPLLEDIPELAEKGGHYVYRVSWRWILDKNAIEINWANEFAGGEKVTGKGLIGWHAAENRMAFGGMNSSGGMSLGTIVFDEDSKTSTLTAKGVDGESNATTFKGVVKKLDRDTITWQALERTGGELEGPSPVYTLKRVKRAAGKKATK